MKIIKIVCCKCQHMRKVVKDTPRHNHRICGECWNWETKEIKE